MKPFVSTLFPMRYTHAVWLAVLTTAFMVTACNKKNTTPSVTERLMQKWTVVQTADTFYSSTASPQITAYTGTSTDYMDIRTDGWMYSFVNNVPDTAGYTYSENNLLFNVKGHHFNIQVLTDQSMVLYDPRYTTTTIGYTASKVTLKR